MILKILTITTNNFEETYTHIEATLLLQRNIQALMSDNVVLLKVAIQRYHSSVLVYCYRFITFRYGRPTIKLDRTSP